MPDLPGRRGRGSHDPAMLVLRECHLCAREMYNGVDQAET